MVVSRMEVFRVDLIQEPPRELVNNEDSGFYPETQEKVTCRAWKSCSVDPQGFIKHSTHENHWDLVSGADLHPPRCSLLW